MKKLIEILTGDDNVTLEPAYLWGAMAFIVGLGLEVYAVANGKPFDLQGYGIGAGALITGLGLGKKLGGNNAST